MSSSKLRTILISLAAVLVVVLVVVMAVLVMTNRNNPTATPSATTSSGSTSPSPTSPSGPPSSSSTQPTIITKYFVNTATEGIVYAAGIKIRGDQVSGWAAPLRSDGVTCFNGKVAGERLTGTLWAPADEGGGPVVSQRFSWRITGSGDQLRLTEVSSIKPLTEVPVTVVNRDADQPADYDWQSTFDSCAKLTGGLT